MLGVDGKRVLHSVHYSLNDVEQQACSTRHDRVTTPPLNKFVDFYNKTLETAVTELVDGYFSRTTPLQSVRNLIAAHVGDDLGGRYPCMSCITGQ